MLSVKSGDSAFHAVSPIGADTDEDSSSPPPLPCSSAVHPQVAPSKVDEGAGIVNCNPQQRHLFLLNHDDSTFSWPSNANYEEERELLGTEEESSEIPSSDDEEDVDRGCSKDVWAITKEQLTYYTSQFLAMQPNPRGVIPGALAKEFFEKSRLPIMELRQIWQLSDVSKDGCLSLEEFLTAMHLVVLRRNEIDLPEELPSCLQPLEIRQKLLIDRHNKDLYDNRHLHISSKTTIIPSKSGILSSNDPPSPSTNQLKRDPNIVAPVAVRLSPDDSPCIQSSDEEEDTIKKIKHGLREVVYEQLWNQEDAVSTTEESISSLTLRNNTTTNNNNDTDDDDVIDIGGGPEEHMPEVAHWISIDLKIIASYGWDCILLLHHLPRYPLNRAPEPSPEYSNNQQQLRGASAVSRAQRQAGEDLLSNSSVNTKSYQQSIHSLKETNSILARTINELHQEVSDTLEERIALEYQLEQLKSFGE
ncbi:REPS [Lepeophtheirus salmonis]|uniref:REPS n=1 Tax=Lepeophtheirus salmonis TaxID=72036 RepID=A0A7R8CJ52_LEPSM|nr:REPS [Lepeophtheirus salmonis]CAF2836009.1 REPS [Lepeophtheirus salmonis]